MRGRGSQKLTFWKVYKLELKTTNSSLRFSLLPFPHSPSPLRPAMNSFPMNALPTEFEEAHGSTDLADTKPLVEDDVEDMDLGLDDVGQRVWLVKVSEGAAGAAEV